MEIHLPEELSDSEDAEDEDDEELVVVGEGEELELFDL